MTINNITSLATRLISIRGEVKQVTEYLQELKLQRDSLQHEMLNTMKDQELLSYKTSNWTISRTIKKDIAIIDEALLIEHLDRKNLTQDYVYQKLDTMRFKTLGKALAEKWETLQGTQLIETEYISIRNPKNWDTTDKE